MRNAVFVGLGIGAGLYLLFQKQKSIAGFLRKLIFIHGLQPVGFKNMQPYVS
jgi:hypothetical protein